MRLNRYKKIIIYLFFTTFSVEINKYLENYFFNAQKNLLLPVYFFNLATMAQQASINSNQYCIPFKLNSQITLQYRQY